MAGKKIKGTNYSLVGVDFGTQTIKAVAITGKEGNFQIAAIAEVPTPKGSVNDGQILDVDKVTNAVRTLMKHIPNRSKFVASSVSGASIISKIMQTNIGITDSEVEEQVTNDAEQTLSFPIEEVNLDHEVLGPNFSDSTKQDVLVTGCRTELVETRLAVFDGLGMQLKVVDIGIHALARAVKATVTGFSSDKVVAIVDLGAVTTTIGFVHQGEVVSQREVPLGGENLHEVASNYTGMSHDEFEKAKLQNRIPQEAYGAVNEFCDRVISNVKRNIQMFTTSTAHKKVDQVVITGGTILLPAVLEKLKASLGQYNVVCPDVFVSNPKFKTEENQFGFKYMTALGLALRSFTPCPI